MSFLVILLTTPQTRFRRRYVLCYTATHAAQCNTKYKHKPSFTYGVDRLWTENVCSGSLSYWSLLTNYIRAPLGETDDAFRLGNQSFPLQVYLKLQ